MLCRSGAEGPGERNDPAGKAAYNKDLGEFIYLYDDLLSESSPDNALLTFLQSSYDAAADLAKWDRTALERAINQTPA